MQQSSTLSKASLRSLASALPRHLPDAETGKRVSEAARAGGGRALAALKRSVRVITAARHFREAGRGNGPQRLQEENKAGATNSASVDQTDGV